jgi:2-dehydropantoate 2-reductase
MGQVPQKDSTYLIIGSGRVARHFSYFLTQNDTQFEVWTRGQSVQTLRQLQKKHANVLLAIRDDAIVPFYQDYKTDENIFIHFSGRVDHEDLLGFHPLMTFSDKLYQKDFYPTIPFVGRHSETLFRVHFPNWENPYYQIKKEDKALYHALCVLSGNGTTLLWELIQQEIAQLGLPPQALKPYLQQVTQLIEQQSPGRFTGPWYRGDQKTVDLHLQALDAHPLKDLYKLLQDHAKGLEKKR